MSQTTDTRDDLIGQPISVGDYVAATIPNSKAIAVFQVIRFSPKQIRIKNGKHEYSVYSGETVRLTEEQVFWYRLKS